METTKVLAEADAMAGAEAMVGLEKCMTQSVLIAASNARCLSSQLKEDRFIAAHVFQNTASFRIE
jgi:hypothetical protein